MRSFITLFCLTCLLISAPWGPCATKNWSKISEFPSYCHPPSCISFLRLFVFPPLIELIHHPVSQKSRHVEMLLSEAFQLQVGKPETAVFLSPPVTQKVDWGRFIIFHPRQIKQSEGIKFCPFLRTINTTLICSYCNTGIKDVRI